MIQQLSVNGEQIIPGRNFALVASRSHPGAWHAVKVVDGAHVCDCLGFQHRERCRHVRAVILAASQPTPTENPTFELAAAMLAGQFDGQPKRRENLRAVEVTAGEDVSYGEWSERRAS